MDVKLKALWGKKDNSGTWLPLVTHLADTAETARLLWDTWVSDVIKERIAQDLPESVTAKDLFVFLAGVHDVGKASPAFQCRAGWNTPDVDKILRANLAFAGFPNTESHATSVRHEFISHCIFIRHKLDPSVAVVIGGHHGRPPEAGDLNRITAEQKSLVGFTSDIWKATQDVIIITEAVDSIPIDVLRQVKLTKPSQILLSALLIMSDWMASNVSHFPLIDLNNYTKLSSKGRAEEAFKYYSLPPCWNANNGVFNLYQERFKIDTPYPVQEAVLGVASESPDLVIIEAPMGEGKTEAALVAAEIIASKRGCRGIYFALPTQATTNAMFARILEWVSKFDTPEIPYSARLMHGKSELNEKFVNLKYKIHDVEDTEPTYQKNLQVHDWFEGRNKGILSDFTVGTIDQVLLAGLKRKFLALRHLGLAGKVVIIDECHAYDVYMQSYLQKVLTYLGAYKVPVVVLSATLPEGTRQKLVNAYLDIRVTDRKRQYLETPTKSYPQITYTKGDSLHIQTVDTVSKAKSIEIQKIRTSDISSILKATLTEGCYVGIIVNTVRKAQQLYTMLSDCYDDVDITLSDCCDDVDITLLHSGFMQVDRVEKEEKLVHDLGKKVLKREDKRIIIGTQIFEQSMDIDFDVLITDLCPVDLLIQRIGRLHRHNRVMRPINKPTCYVLDTEWGEFDRGSQYVYGPYLLAKTKAILPDVINIPVDIPLLVAQVYSDDEPMIPKEHQNWYKKALDKYQENNTIREGNSKNFQVADPRGNTSPILGWLSGDSLSSELMASASVRGMSDSLEVIPIIRKQGGFYPMGRTKIESIPVGIDSDTAKYLASCSLRLPYVFSLHASAYERELEKTKKDYNLKDTWCHSYGLKYANFLIFDENYQAQLGNYKLTYSYEKGIEYSVIK